MARDLDQSAYEKAQKPVGARDGLGLKGWGFATSAPASLFLLAGS
ncbi:MAG: hypothetical protein ACLPID_17725 [Beijerinckiaceae bacterium]